ncbi:major capsid protein [Anaerocolumna sp.]|uniref:major capsid protein n=1 Tax=Anaerocolumna sp. TaxID=2041569 RepID=UPI0028A60FCC|nr:major capsid protein [Anaerocolumna sp.]
MPDITRVIDVIQPGVFTPYTINRTMELSALIQSGIAENSVEFDDLASGPNLTANMPFWNDLEGDLEVMDDEGESSPGNIGSDKDIARKLGFVKSYGANALAALLSGDDPMRAIANLFAAYWNRQYQSVLLTTLDGVFAASNMTEKVYDITGKTGNAALINGTSFLDANQLMGDAKDLLTGVMMHSMTETRLAKNDLIEYRQESQGSTRVPYFMNKRVIVDDSMAFDTETGASEAYLFGAGAIAWGNGKHKDIKETELVRNGLSLAGEDILVNRRISILHPRGVKWVEPADGLKKKFPDLKELATGANWNRVYDPKKIRIVKFMFKVD